MNRVYNRLILAISLSLFVLVCVAQKQIKGTVVDEKGDPIPFVNIGIQDSYVGTISELNGEFNLIIPEKYSKEVLLFSCIGYYGSSRDIQVNIGRKIEVILKEDVRKLNDVIISEKKLKAKIEKVGNANESMEGRFMADTSYSGSAIAQLVTTPFDTTFIHWLNLGYLNKIKDLKMRIKFKKVDANMMPGELIINKEIIVDLIEFEGFHRITLDTLFLFVTEKNFFIEFEPLVLKKDRKRSHEIITAALKDSPELIQYNQYGEILINNEQLDLNYIQFKITSERTQSTFYRTSSFGKWYYSEELALKVGLSDGSNMSNPDLSKEKILARIFKVKKEKEKVETSIDTYENENKVIYSSLADHLRRIGGVTVMGKGHDITVTIRQGALSTASVEPIFIIDGMNIGRGYRNADRSVDINKIESIHLLRGLSQTAIYGEEGRNGVILIKTKGN